MDQFEKFQDKILICVDCKEEFVFSIGAQEYFAEHGFTEEPKRCRSCHHYPPRMRTRRTDDKDGAPTLQPPIPSGSPSHQDQD